MSKDFKETVENRRSIYAIGKEQVVPDSKILEVINHSVKYAPTAFNSQSSRVIVLFGGHHDRLWDITKAILEKIVPPENFAQTKEKLDSFRGGYGTVLYFEDQSIVGGLQQAYPLFKDNFPVWSLQASGMLQFIIWSALEAEGLGVSLQHYNPLIDAQVKKEWSVPDSWKLLSEMPFGSPLAPPPEKSFMPLEERIKVFK